MGGHHPPCSWVPYPPRVRRRKAMCRSKAEGGHMRIRINPGWIGLGRFGLRRVDQRPILLVRDRRHRRRNRLRRRNRQCAEVVPGPPRSLRGVDSRSFRYRHSDDDRTNRRHAQSFRLSAHVHRVGDYTGSGGASFFAFPWRDHRWVGLHPTGKRKKRRSEGR